MMACWIASRDSPVSWSGPLGPGRPSGFAIRPGLAVLAGPAGRGPGRVLRRLAVGAVPGQLQAQRHQVIQHAEVQVAGDDRGDRRIAGDAAGGVAVQPGPAVPAGAAGYRGTAGGPPDPRLGDPLGFQHRPGIHRAQLGQRDMRPDFTGCPARSGSSPEATRRRIASWRPS